MIPFNKPFMTGRWAVSRTLRDRKSVVEGKSVDLGGRRIIKKKTVHSRRPACCAAGAAVVVVMTSPLRRT